MKERRRDLRVPFVLDVMLKRTGWEHNLSENISRRGLFIRRVTACPVTNLIQVRVALPGQKKPLEMLAKVSRTVPLPMAMHGDKLPGIGLEFFCLSGEALQRWDLFVLAAARIYEQEPALNGYDLYERMREDVVSRKPGTGSEGYQGAVADDGRTHLIFRAHSLDRLKSFMTRELKSGRLDIRIPYRLGMDARVNLRVVHPDTEVEFLLPGTVARCLGSEGIQVQFDNLGRSLVKRFGRFVESGEVPGVPGDSLAAA